MEKMNQNIGRKNGLRIPNMIPNIKLNSESQEDKIEISKAVSQAQNNKYKTENEIALEHTDIDKDTKIPHDASELIVITKAKKLCAYVITITEKSPKRFRAVFINRMQNYCLDCLENLVEANSIKMDNIKNKERRRECQRMAFLKLKLLGYISFLALENECILKKQYQQISIQLSDCINLLVAWRKSDAERKY